MISFNPCKNASRRAHAVNCHGTTSLGPSAFERGERSTVTVHVEATSKRNLMRSLMRVRLSIGAMLRQRMCRRSGSEATRSLAQVWAICRDVEALRVPVATVRGCVRLLLFGAELAADEEVVFAWG